MSGMSRVLLFALLLAGVDAVSRAVKHVIAVDQVTKSWSSIVSELWSDLVIDENDEPIDFAKKDKAVEDQFVDDCICVLDVHEGSVDAVDKVIADRCSGAGGTDAECKDMTKTLGEARKEKKLKPWCEKTFAWFAAKTKPRCLKKCKALLCKDRCDQDDKVKDISDEISAYQIKLDTVSSKEKRLDEFAKDQEKTLAKIETLDKTKCVPAGEDVKKLETSQKSLGKEMTAAVAAAEKAGDEKDKSFDSLKKLKADKQAKTADKSKAETEFKDRSAAFLKAKEEQAAKNKELLEVTGKLKEATSTQSFQCKKVKDMKEEYQSIKKTYDDEVNAVAEEKTKTQDKMDKAIAAKKKLEAPLKAALKAA